MQRPWLPVRRRGLMAYVVLAALLLRAYIPAGFMPASGTPFLLELCPAAISMPMTMPMPAGHHHDPGGHGHFEHCPFGSASFAGPLPSLPPLDAPAHTESRCIVAAEDRMVRARLDRAHRARGPPLLLVV